MTPVQALRTDLCRTGAAASAREEACTAYAHALVERSSKRWKNFYRALYDALLTAPSAQSAIASRSLLLILEDDLGVQLFTAAELHVLRSKLGISDACAGQSLQGVSVVC